ncbi:hypothetical protein CDAR_65921 [Caerostris darwini]|uniref:Uncharacterized protein n=1 Tax=Caerostris darwini TaxID=1538125 RepID=A0AAV4UC65_9ARAC|nr:hypothetical protein CDAR_65921 [Caerostris darwini]
MQISLVASSVRRLPYPQSTSRSCLNKVKRWIKEGFPKESEECVGVCAGSLSNVSLLGSVLNNPPDSSREEEKPC